MSKKLLIFEKRGIYYLCRRKTQLVKEENNSKEKDPSEGSFSVIGTCGEVFSESATCHLPKEDDWLDTEVHKPHVKESAHKNEWLKITPSSVVGLGA